MNQWYFLAISAALMLLIYPAYRLDSWMDERSIRSAQKSGLAGDGLAAFSSEVRSSGYKPFAMFVGFGSMAFLLVFASMVIRSAK